MNSDHNEQLRYQEEIETFLHDIYFNRSWQSKNRYRKRIRILTYLVWYRVLSLDQVMELFHIPKEHMSTEYAGLRRLVKEGYVKDRRLGEPSNVTLYYITAAGITYLLSLLRKLTPEKGDTLLSEACLEYIERTKEQKRSIESSGNLLHLLRTQDTAIYLLSGYGSRSYHFYHEIFVGRQGDIYLGSERFIHGKPRQDVLFRPDGLFAIQHRGKEYRVFLEHDTGTQRKKVLAGKLENYSNTLFDTKEHRTQNELLFSLYIPIEAYGKKAEKYYSTPDRFTHLFFCLRLMAGLLCKDMDPWDMPVANLQLYMEMECKKDAYLGNHDNALLSLCRKLCEHNPYLTLKDAKKALIRQKKEEAGQNILLSEKERRKRFEQRRNVLFDAMVETDIFYNCMLQGLSAYAIISPGGSQIISGLSPVISGTFFERIVKIIAGALGETLTGEYDEKGDADSYCLCHRYVLTDNRSFYVENITHDCGGAMRALHYTKQKGSPEKGYLILLCLQGVTPYRAAEFSALLPPSGLTIKYVLWNDGQLQIQDTLIETERTGPVDEK